MTRCYSGLVPIAIGVGLFLAGLCLGKFYESNVASWNTITAVPSLLDANQSTPEIMLLLRGASGQARSVAWRARQRFDATEAAKEGYKATGPGHDLTPTDRTILADLCFQASSVYETGVGESTKICTFTGVPRFTGVDSSTEWLATVMQAAPPHYRFHWADIGPVGQYSHPTNSEAAPKWPLASVAALVAESQAFDLYMVDGRFRVASFVANMLHALHHGKTDALFTMHDYRVRPNYHVVESVGRLVRGAGSEVDAEGAEIAVFEMRGDVTVQKLVALWEKHKGDEK